MRDSKVLFRDNVAASTASAVVDANSSEPGIGSVAYIGASVANATIAGSVTLSLLTSNTKDGTFEECAKFTIDADIAKKQGVIFSEPMPSTAKRFLKTVWTGITGGTMTDGLDWGLKNGKAATKPYLA